MEPHHISDAAVIKCSSHQEPANFSHPAHSAGQWKGLAAYIKDAHSLRVSGHGGGAAIRGVETDLPPAGTLNAKLERLLFHQRPKSVTRKAETLQTTIKALRFLFKGMSEALKS